jgi:formate-dependent nitrite reductase membrane component NrfD
MTMREPSDPGGPGLQPQNAPEALEQTLKGTAFLASLAPEYTEGRAPANQHRDGHVPPPSPTYYDLPAIKKPEWKWHVDAYFFVGGVASGAYILAALVDLAGRPEERSLARAGRYLQFGSLLLCPPLLMADLGRPERFHHMLRVFRPRSMMSQGSWALALFGPFSGAAALLQALQDLTPHSRLTRFLTLPLRTFSWLGIPLAAYVGSYTGVLLSATNVPLWAGNRHWMGPLFFSSALSAGLAGARLTARMLGPLSEETEERLDRAETVMLGTELALTGASALELGRLAAPLKTGSLARVYQAGAIGLGLLVPLAFKKWEKKRPLLRVLSSVLVLAGSAIAKSVITEAGKRSADDPRAYFEYTRPKR